MRKTAVISVSLAQSLADNLRDLVAREGISVTEFVRDAVRQRMQMFQWRKIRARGAAAAKRHAVSPEDVESIVDEFRS